MELPVPPFMEKGKRPGSAHAHYMTVNKTNVHAHYHSKNSFHSSIQI